MVKPCLFILPKLVWLILAFLNGYTQISLIINACKSKIDFTQPIGCWCKFKDPDQNVLLMNKYLFPQYILKCLNIGTPKIINFPSVPNGKLMIYRSPNIYAYEGRWAFATSLRHFGSSSLYNLCCGSLLNCLSEADILGWYNMKLS